MRVFLSYSRADAEVAASVAEDVRQMGHTAWFDREVLGGQAWWSTILRQIRECDLYILILTPHSLDSQACRAEYTYAAQLKRNVLPVLCQDGVKVSLLPPELSMIQFLDYRAQDKHAAFAIVRAIKEAPEATPLPDPLPPEPPIPLSYLGDLRGQIETAVDLTLAAQRDLLFEVKSRLKDPESGADAWELLRLLRGRQDLLASVAEEIDSIQERKPQRKPPRKPPVKKADQPAEAEAPKPVTPAEAETVREEPVVTTPVVTGPAMTIELAGDLRPLEGLVTRAASNPAERWVIKAGEDAMRVFVENQQLVLEATFRRWGEKDGKCLKAMGWTPIGKGMQQAAGVAFGALAIATYGLGLGLLAHKGTRDFLNKNVARKEFPPVKAGDAAASIVDCFRLLCPTVKQVVASQEQAPVT